MEQEKNDVLFTCNHGVKRGPRSQLEARLREEATLQEALAGGLVGVCSSLMWKRRRCV